METSNNYQNEKYYRAKKQVKEIRGFYSHLIIYLIFCVFFIFLNSRSGGFPWAIFPIAGWGLGVLGHASEAFNYSIFFGKDWEERKIKEIMDKERF